ncbi:MAG TPA: 16S rRNA (cytosine(1402)-N(4))-methyltransferase RsmH [Deltaproteobacteria bacterium]|nr:16S rRNA (cytosine(1402)-N(4))-methyltransferase RsmH [Deltaproteobacteria bacterium]
MEYLHAPVLVKEVVKHLVYDSEGVYVDGTAGTGGHSAAILDRLAGRGRLICLDRDPDAVRLSKKRLATSGDKVCLIKANFADLDGVFKDLNIRRVQGVLLDLGMSSYQLEKSGRGFSFSRGEPLDMRMNPDNDLVASHLVNDIPPKDLEQILRDYGEERNAKSIVRAIVRERAKRPIETSSQLAGLIDAVSPKSRRYRARHPATRTFQALRIAVNKELQNLDTFLNKIPSLLALNGRLVVLSYHSLEDRRVKRTMNEWEKPCSCPPDFPHCVCGKVPLFRPLFKKGLKPSQNEIDKNPRARSAIMRAAERVSP